MFNFFIIASPVPHPYTRILRSECSREIRKLILKDISQTESIVRVNYSGATNLFVISVAMFVSLPAFVSRDTGQ